MNGGEHISSGLDDKIDEAFTGPIDEAEAMGLSHSIGDYLMHEFPGHPRVVHENTGETVSHSLQLSGDLDPGIFMDELRWLSQVDVSYEYSTDRKSDLAVPKYTIGWQAHNGENELVTIREGDAPKITTWGDALDGSEPDGVESGLNLSQANTLKEVVTAVDTVLNEQDTFVRNGRGDDTIMHRYDGRRGSRD